MDARLFGLLLVSLACLVPAVAADLVTETLALYPHCSNPLDIVESPRGCLCPWPDPLRHVVCPLPG